MKNLQFHVTLQVICRKPNIFKADKQKEKTKVIIILIPGYLWGKGWKIGY